MKKMVGFAFLLCLGWVTCAQADLLVAYSFEGDDYTDGSGNGYDGTPGGSGHSFSSDTPVCSARSLVLDGNGWVDVPINAVNPFDGSGDFSIVAWFKTSTTGAPVLISSARDNDPNNHSMAVFANTEENTYAVTYDNFYVSRVVTGTGCLNDGQWHHYAVVYEASGNNFTVYLDGYPDAIASFDPDIPNISEDTVRIGNTLNTEFPAEVGPAGWVGSIDEIAIYNHALAPAEIKDISKAWGNFVDFAIFASHWLDTGCSAPDWCDCADLSADGVVDLNDLRAFTDNWLKSSSIIEPCITYQIGDCIYGCGGWVEDTTFSVTVEGSYIHFESTFRASCCPDCCPDKLELEMTVQGNLIEIHEIEYFTWPPPCDEECNHSTSAVLGPFEDGTYTVDVCDYRDVPFPKIIFVGSETVTIGPPE